MNSAKSVLQEGRVPVLSRRTMWTIRLVVLGILGIWIAGAIYFRHQVSYYRAKVEQRHLEEQRREERLKRNAVYQQNLQQRSQPSRVRNAIDGH